MAKKQFYFSQEILFMTEHFGKNYFYLKDVDGHIYLAKAKPVYRGVSVDPVSSEHTPIQVGWEPGLV